MFPDVRRRRSPKLFLLVTALTLTLTACGPDLGKSNFARTTVPATPGGTPAADGPITDPAVAADVLRPVKPCQFLTKEALGATGLGTVPDDPHASTVTFDGCSNTVKDPGGKEIRFTLAVGSSLIPLGNTATGQIGGLPLRVRKDGTDGCTLAAMTSLQPDLGIVTAVTYTGDACRAGQTLLDAVVRKLHSSPEKYDTPQGTLLTVDPCKSADAAAIEAAVKSPQSAAVSLHSCDWRSNGGDPTLTVEFKPGLPPLEGNGYSKVDLGGGVTGFQKKGTGSGVAKCEVEWQHRAWQGDDVELDRTRGRAPAGGSGDDPCAKVVGVAKNVVTKLPKP